MWYVKRGPNTNTKRPAKETYICMYCDKHMTPAHSANVIRQKRPKHKHKETCERDIYMYVLWQTRDARTQCQRVGSRPQLCTPKKYVKRDPNTNIKSPAKETYICMYCDLHMTPTHSATAHPNKYVKRDPNTYVKRPAPQTQKQWVGCKSRLRTPTLRKCVTQDAYI